jgi:hypothetical protein
MTTQKTRTVVKVARVRVTLDVPSHGGKTSRHIKFPIADII